MKFQVTFRDSDITDVVEVTFDTLCKFEDEFGVSGLQLDSNMQLKWIAWCVWRAWVDSMPHPSRNPEQSHEDWRRTVETIEPLADDDSNPTLPTV